jgi:polyhydroxybutyrate depolymerase
VWISPEPFPSVTTWAANWAQRNRCGPNPVESAVAADVTRLEYTDCADDAAVVLYTVQGGGHQWPGGKPLPAWMEVEMALFGLRVGPYSRSIDATNLMWAFFREHQLLRN